ncbi:hypothetical protein BVG19_g568 [[Candida] boidinii]|nr:hypothetical protein BVG19_g568 [[Candida] boidinii]OWB51477.1 hypothetical protein B5S27_g3040 [[Candida] boidinii]OWB65577.1 hypothetical protein B5S30_g903 [[Candida] boidinii]
MSKKDNLLWKLDVLQVKFEKTTPRYGTTKAILKSKDKKKIDKIIGKNTNHIRAKEQILALQTDICERKFHSSLIKLNRILKKNIRTVSKKSKNTDPLDIFIGENGDKQLDDLVHSKIVKIAESVFTKTKLSKLNPPDFLPDWCKIAIKDVNNEYSPKFQYKKQTQEVNNLISKLYNDKAVKELLKSIEASFAIILGPVDKELSTAKELEDEAKEDSESEDSDSDDSDSSDSDDDSESSKKSIADAENSGEPHQYDPDLLCDQYKAYVIGTDDEEDDEEPDFKSSSINYNEVTDEEPSEDEEVVDAEAEAVSSVDQEENDIEMADKLYDQYKDYVGGSSDEDEGEEVVLDKEIDYEQVTDEEPSEEEEDIDLEKIQEIQDKEFEDAKKIKKSLMNDEFFEEDEKDRKKREKREKKEKKQKEKEKSVLPALATGYYSGGESDSDVDKDEVVQQATKVRKNRRGQRARQKIWEKKFGTGANHVKKESERVKSEKERKKLEFEERARKRMEKQKIIDEKHLRRGYGGSKDIYDRNSLGSSSNNNRYNSPQPQADKPEKLHPSWEAKKKAEESLQNVKFSGKKITFD